MKIDLDSFVVFGAHLFVFYLLSAESNRNENENEKKAKLHDDDYHIWVNYWLKGKKKINRKTNQTEEEEEEENGSD